jgi:hypothetical protein
VAIERKNQHLISDSCLCAMLFGRDAKMSQRFRELVLGFPVPMIGF